MERLLPLQSSVSLVTVSVIHFSSLLLAPRIHLIAAVNTILERTSHVTVDIFPQMLYKFYSLSLMRIEGKRDRPVVLEKSSTLAAIP